MSNELTDREIILLILDEVKDLKQKVDNLETKVDNIEIKVDNLETKVDNLETKVDNLDAQVGHLETQQKQTQATLETTIDNCIKALSEGYQANHETIDNLHINALRSKVTQLELLEQFNRNEIVMLKQKLI